MPTFKTHDRGSRAALFAAALLLLTFSTCGPLIVPMVDRLNSKQQAEFEQGWKNAITAGNELDRQGWLDVMVVTLAFQRGVDRLQLRSEKEVDEYLAVMEVRFDRARPDDDAFILTIFDQERRIIRKEEYDRDDVEEAIKSMYRGYPEHVDDAESSDQWKERRQKILARQDRVKQLFPISTEKDELPADAAAPENY